MERTTRTALLLVALVGSLAFAAPTAVALDDESDDDGLKYCKRVQGRYVCVAVDYGGCELWFSIGFGGCWIVPQ